MVALYTVVKPLNSLWPSDVIWWQRSGSTLAQVMTCCLTAPHHYLNQCWLIIRAGVKYVLSNTNTFFPEFQIQIQIHQQKSYQIQIQIQLIKYKYTMRPRQNCRHFTDDVLFIQISLKIVSKGPIYNKPTLVQIMAWGWVGNKPLSDQWWPGLLMHECITRPKWVHIKCSVADCYFNVV